MGLSIDRGLEEMAEGLAAFRIAKICDMYDTPVLPGYLNGTH